MSEFTQALVDAVTDACVRHPSTTSTIEAGWNAPLWSALEQIGITLLSVPEERGGAGGDILTAAAVLEVLGEHSATVPYVETALQAAWLLAAARAPIPAGPLSAAVGTGSVSLDRTSTGWVLDGTVNRVPYARHVAHVVLLVGEHVVMVRSREFEALHGANLAGEARDSVTFDRVALASDRVFDASGTEATAALFEARGAVGRMAQTAGAAKRALEMSLAYSAERTQFGRPVSAFQAVQHLIAETAGEVAVCKVVAESAALALDEVAEYSFAVGAARTSAGYSAGAVARIAHQIHGAIGFTEEHDLRLSTTRIWSWREEFGSVRRWSESVGTAVVDAGADGLWPMLTAHTVAADAPN
ncbi:acyl-CoA dehydrogenase family protein [Rhodococcus sp. NBC_00294]|uniref:acyl-CoA dehydrogenase family protein n=1 Tax=Rhodococcus sp. NBC_00294 TaxID=2976004 RepID=UPI002E2BBE2D|nr:acyl-CoA dehydrogenase family protein [Rhodococcus sp. NBC_00294]